MESSLNHDASWTAATNWTIAGGSLVDSLAFESSLSPITNEDNNDQDQFSTVDSKSKSPVILYAPTSDPAPCEITINFAQKHEVRQVYVRSTARVYEIYCAPEQQSSTEYLCTVRCGIAARDEEVILATNVEAVWAHARSSIQEPAEEKLRNGSSLSPNEDDWVEVKALDSPLAINRNSSSSNSDIKPERNSQNLQVFYEATAEITDANPSTSLTLRLLSLQNKGYVCVDEVYVFGDPADASNSDNQVSPMENSAGNSLMAMLVPAFFQMSKSKGIGGGEDKYNIDTRERQNSQDNGSKATAPADAEKKIQEEERLQEAAGPTSKSVQHEISQQVSNTESKPNISHNHFEGVLDVLVSRVNRIEDLLLRFEESMMKPINSIDVRLQRVEQQLDALTKKTENPALVCCTGISAPDFSCSEPETNSYNSISRDISYAACEANRSNSPSSLTSVLPDVASVSVNDIKIQPGLVVTAPEFLNYDDEEEDHAVESVKESPKDKQKHTMSIDDALAYALAGFLSSTSIQSQKYSPTLAVKTPDFSSTEENIDEHMTPPIAESERNMDPPTCFCEPDGTEHLGNPLSSVSNITSLEGEKNVMRSLNDNNSSKMVSGVDEQCHRNDSPDICVGHAVAPAAHDVEGTDSYHLENNMKDGKIDDKISKIPSLQKTESLEQFSKDQTDGSVTAQEIAISNELVASKEGTEEVSKQDILQNIVELSRASSVVDFESPILEVKFVSQENSGMKSPLEALLAGMPDLEVEVPSVLEDNNDGSENGDQYSLISVEGFGAIGSGTDSHMSVDMDYYSLNETPSVIEADKLHDCYTSSSQEMPAVSLI